MFVNRAEWGRPHEDIESTDSPLLITSVGQYRFTSVPSLRTYREQGRGDYQLLYIATGCGYFALDGQVQTLPQGTAVLYRPGVTQDYTFCSSDKAEYFWCHFTGSEVEALLADCRIEDHTMVFSPGTSSDFRWLFLQMIRELQTKQDRYDTILQMNLRHILLLLGRHPITEQETGGTMLGEIENAIRFFDMNYHYPIEIQQYAESHLMSPYWFSQHFKKVTGCSPAQYLIALRMSNAMNLLDNTDHTVAQVALAVGYENTQYFHRLFRKHTGMTPSEYKARNKQK